MFYRLKHLPTGLYFCPSREIKVYDTDPETQRTVDGYVKSNLSERGKVYTRRPTLKYVSGTIYTHKNVRWRRDLNWAWYVPINTVLPFIQSEWEIEVNP